MTATTTTSTTLTEPPGFESGTRLRARTYVGDDGSRQFAGWHDSERNEDCAFAQAGDGKLRCLPTAVFASYFTDAQCTAPAIIVASCTPLPNYARTGTGVSGCINYGPITSVGATVSTIFSGPSCTQGVVPAGYTAYSVGAEIPPTSFVAATEQVE